MSMVCLSLAQNTDPLFAFIGKIKYKTGSAPAGSGTKRLLTPASSKAIKATGQVAVLQLL